MRTDTRTLEFGRAVESDSDIEIADGDERTGGPPSASSPNSENGLVSCRGLGRKVSPRASSASTQDMNVIFRRVLVRDRH